MYFIKKKQMFPQIKLSSERYLVAAVSQESKMVYDADDSTKQEKDVQNFAFF